MILSSMYIYVYLCFMSIWNIFEDKFAHIINDNVRDIKPLLDYIQFPQDIKGYGPIDTFIMTCCNYIPNVTQYKIKNLVIAEDYKYSDRTLYSDYVKVINRKLEASDLNWNKMISHLQNNILKR